MIKANFNAYDKYVTDSLYQWDLNQVLRVTGLNLSVVPEVHFSNANMDKAIVRQASMENHVVNVDIPNSLLQDPLTINAHIGIYEGSTFKVVERVEIPVIAKERPTDYQIQGADEEIYSFKALENALENKADNVRVDNIIAHNNDTDGNSELVDMRTDIFGTIHDSAGSAIRHGFKLQNDVSETIFDTEYLTVAYTKKFNDMGFALNNQGQAILMSNSGTTLYHGVIEKSGLYNLSAQTLITPVELRDSEYLPYSSYDAIAKTDVFLTAGTHFYLFGGNGILPQIKTHYISEQIVVSVSPDETLYEITEGAIINGTSRGGLLEDTRAIFDNGTRYRLYTYPVKCGKVYRLTNESFRYPSTIYQLFGFTKTIDNPKNISYIPGGIYTSDIATPIDILVKSPIDGYLIVSFDVNYTSDFTLTEISNLRKIGYIDRSEVRPYNKLLTIGDSLSGNENLWQSAVIELLNIPEYTTLGGAGLSVADQGDDVNTIYNRVMKMTVDDSVDIVTFWGGYNDFSANITLSSLDEQIDKETRDATTFYGGVLDCIEKILSVYPLKQIVMIGTTPFRFSTADGYIEWRNRTNGQGYTIADYVEAFRKVAEYYSIPFLNLLYTSGFNEYNYETYYLTQTNTIGDYWLHPNTVGHALIGRKIAGFIKSIDGKI